MASEAANEVAGPSVGQPGIPGLSRVDHDVGKRAGAAVPEPDSEWFADLDSLPETDRLGRLVCRRCGLYFAKLGGWHTRHVVYCTGDNLKNSQVRRITGFLLPTVLSQEYHKVIRISRMWPFALCKRRITVFHPWAGTSPTTAKITTCIFRSVF
jgi:hypothetical protein